MKGYLVEKKKLITEKEPFVPGREYELTNDSVCEKGFRFCKELDQCFKIGDNIDIYSWFFEIEALSDVTENKVLSTYYATRIKVIREIPKKEILEKVNAGRFNLGFLNNGDHNTGNYNIGSRNTGNSNSGDDNSGSHNTGTVIAGDGNEGNKNTGWFNNGSMNTGSNNLGDKNTGDYNHGDKNTGGYNVGDCNCGDNNTGDHNIGDHNHGNNNLGYFNSASYANGCFNTEKSKIFFFNKESDWTLEDWINSKERLVWNSVIYGHVSLTDSIKEILRGIPNFDEGIFKEITGIDINKDTEAKKRPVLDSWDLDEPIML